MYMSGLYSGSYLREGKIAYFEMTGGGGKIINILYWIPFMKIQGGQKISKGAPCPPKYSPACNMNIFMSTYMYSV